MSTEVKKKRTRKPAAITTDKLLEAIQTLPITEAVEVFKAAKVRVAALEAQIKTNLELIESL